MAYGLHADLPDGTATPGYEEWNQLLGSIRAAIFGSPGDMGGDIDTPHAGASYRRIARSRPFQLPAAEQGGGVWKVRCYCKCVNAATTITPRVRNITTGTDIVTGSACSGTSDAFTGTNQNQLLTWTPTPGELYEVWATKSDLLNDCFITTRLERTNS